MEDRGEFTIFKMECDELLSQDPPANGESELGAIEKAWGGFVEQTELAAVGGRADLNPRQRLRSEPDFSKRTGADVDHILEKSAGDRRRAGLLQWLREQVALGKSVSELIAHARRHDLATGNLLAECVAEL